MQTKGIQRFCSESEEQAKANQEKVVRAFEKTKGTQLKQPIWTVEKHKHMLKITNETHKTNIMEEN